MNFLKKALFCLAVIFSASPVSISASTQLELQSQLMQAVERGQIEEVVEIVLLKGVDGDALNRAFISSAQNGKTELVAFFLLYTDVDANLRDALDQTALIHAAAKGYVDTVSVLMALGANLDLTDEEGKTALMHAEAAGHTQVVEALISAGANSNY
jgi:ankyrin repeat protein